MRYYIKPSGLMLEMQSISNKLRIAKQFSVKRKEEDKMSNMRITQFKKFLKESPEAVAKAFLSREKQGENRFARDFDLGTAALIASSYVLNKAGIYVSAKEFTTDWSEQKIDLRFWTDVPKIDSGRSTPSVTANPQIFLVEGCGRVPYNSVHYGDDTLSLYSVLEKLVLPGVLIQSADKIEGITSEMYKLTKK